MSDDVFKLVPFTGKKKMGIILGWKTNCLNIMLGQHLVNDVEGHANRG
jgi:hypothetical protein